MQPALRLVLGGCALAVTTVAHAATPISLPIDSFAPDAGAIELPVPPPPRVARPEPQIRLVIKRQLRPGCQGDSPQPSLDRRQATRAAAADPWSTTPVWFRLG
ncbi:MAG TPA: hypothetical protein VMF13_04295 [Luteitalea sp.]|nr:hypothetical protein [Luteitalea sp.]